MNYLHKRNFSIIASNSLNYHKKMNFLKNSVNLPTNSKYIKIKSKSSELSSINSYSTSVNIILLSQMGPPLAIILGRYVQKRWLSPSYFDRNNLIKVFSRHRFQFLSVIGLLTGISYYLYNKFLNETPITGRKRLLINEVDYDSVSEMLFKILYSKYKKQMLPNNHKITKRVDGIVKKLLESNKEFDTLSNKEWKVYVIKEPNIANAFVLPTGHIFVCTGIINISENDSQLGAILAHELSHILLTHGKEVVSRELLLDFVQTCICFALWIQLKPIKALTLTLFSGLLLRSLFMLPKRRAMEIEADFVGLFLTAKTCYDVREGSAFWMKMAAKEQPKWFRISTHPNNKTRYEYMDSYIKPMIQLMKILDCPELSESDPRKVMKQRYSDIQPLFVRISKNDKHGKD